MVFILVFIGSGLGGLCRYLMSNLIYTWLNPKLPLATFAVNIIGSFLMGFLFVWSMDKLALQNESLRALCLVGFLGGFTTFSAFSLESINIFYLNGIFWGVLNVFGQVLLCLVMAWVGVYLGKQL